MPIRNGFGIIAPPLEVPGCICWLNFDDPDSITLNGSDISKIEDLSGNAIDFNQPTAVFQPQYILNGLNNLTVARFNGSTDHMVGPTNFLATDENTIIGLWKEAPGAISGDNIFSKYGAIPSQLITLQARNNDGDFHLFARDGSSNVLQVTSSVDPSGFNVYTAIREPGRLEVHVNSTITTNSGTYLSTVLNGGSQAAVLGAQRQFGAPTTVFSWFQGDLAQILFYDRVLPAPELNFVKAYLANIGGIAL